MKLFLYTTSCCHLCDRALEVIQASLRWQTYALEMIEIADSEALIEAYGTKIPVLEMHVGGNQLCWPFTGKELRQFVKSERRGNH